MKTFDTLEFGHGVATQRDDQDLDWTTTTKKHNVEMVLGLRRGQVSRRVEEDQ